MIADRIENADLYLPVSPRIAMALKALRDTDLATRKEGRYDLDGDKCYALVQHYDTLPLELCHWESHRDYIDVQYVGKGNERMGWAPIGSLKVKHEYKKENDALLYTGDGNFITYTPRTFAIFFPEDGHMPRLMAATKEPIVKVVVKVAV